MKRFCRNMMASLSKAQRANTLQRAIETDDSLLLAVAQLRKSAKYSDLTLTCNKVEFKVHKAIVCSQSPVLAAACDGDFKVRQQFGIE